MNDNSQSWGQYLPDLFVTLTVCAVLTALFGYV